jgi:hypothetical protein
VIQLDCSRVEALIHEWVTSREEFPPVVEHDSFVSFITWAANKPNQPIKAERLGFRMVFPIHTRVWRSAVDRYRFQQCMARLSNGVN